MRGTAASFALALWWIGAQPLQADSPLTYGNDALRAWVERLSHEEPYLLIDRAENAVQLMQGGVQLRSCPLRTEALQTLPTVRDTLVARVRRYRTLIPLSPIKPGPFDWEDRLVHEAPDDGALYFSSGLVLAADPVWQSENTPSVLVDTLDFRTLFNACPEGTVLVYLPADWQREEQ